MSHIRRQFNPVLAPAFFTTCLATLFVSLKLTDYIAWSWTWVLSPLWIGGALGIVVLFVAVGLTEMKS